MTLMKFTGASGDRGFLSFFPVNNDAMRLYEEIDSAAQVHGTSLYENNTLVSGDNKGMAAYLYESTPVLLSPQIQAYRQIGYIEPNTAPGNTSFVAGFVQGAP